MSWFLYVLKCSDDTLYTGITTDPERRLSEHNNSPKGARYTRARRPVTMLVRWEYDTRSTASKAEHRFKKIARDEKLKRVQTDQPILVT